jgi:nucleotide-binding universal stress UspA family protein
VFSHLFVPLDGSALAECVLPHVVHLARACDARLTLVRVLENPAGASQEQPVDPLDWEMRKAEATAYLENTAERLQEAGLAVEELLLEGDPAQRIVESARDHAADLIVLSSHGHSGLSRWNVSSVVLKIVQRAGMATLIVRAYRPVVKDLEGLRYERILVPLDGSQRAECVLAAVTPLASAGESEILLAHVVYEPEMPRRSPPSEEDVELTERFVARNREIAAKYLEQMESRLSGKVRSRLLVGDDVVDTLQDLVESEEVDLVVLSAHGYSGNPRRPYGSITTNFIEYDSAPLLVVQDLSPEEIEPTEAERAAQEDKGH